MQPSGTMISSGFRQPAFRGISSSTKVRNTYKTAATVMARGALKLSGNWALVPEKSMRAERRSRSTRTATWICAPLSRANVNRPSRSDVMTSRGHEEAGLFQLEEDRGDHRYIGQMSASVIGIVEHVHVAAPHRGVA